MLRLLVLCLLAVPPAAVAQDLRQSLIGSWKGDGNVRVRPTSAGDRTNCTASFAEVSGFWLGGSVSCKRGRQRDMVQLRFSEPDRKGQMAVNLYDDDGDVLVTFEGQLADGRLALYHPETLEFGGTEYQPVLMFSVDGANRFQLQQLGVPTRSDAQGYTMSEILFGRDE